MSTDAPLDANSPLSIFRVILLARSSATIRLGEELRVDGWPSTYGDLTLSLRTYHDDPGIGAVVPILLVTDVAGPCESLDRALRAFADAAHSVAAVLAVATNAAVDAPTLERGYQWTPSSPHRAFYQNLAPAVAGNARRARVVDREAAMEVLSAVAHDADRERILRAARQYRLALSYWEPGNETLALAHLYMGVETITEALLRLELETQGLREEQLADKWGLSDVERGRLHSSLVSHTRRRVVFQGDVQTHQSAREASDGFEHGYSSLEEVDANARHAREETATYLREAILTAARLENDWRSRLTASPFNFPVHGGADTHEARANLYGEGQLAPPGAFHPGVVISWLPTRAHQEAGKTTVRHDAVGEWELAPGITANEFRLISETPPVDSEGRDTKPVATGLWRLPSRPPEPKQ